MRSRAVLPAAGHASAGVAPLLTDLDFSALLADKAFDSDAIRADLDDPGAAAVILRWTPMFGQRKGGVKRESRRGLEARIHAVRVVAEERLSLFLGDM